MSGIISQGTNVLAALGGDNITSQPNHGRVTGFTAGILAGIEELSGGLDFNLKGPALKSEHKPGAPEAGQ